MPAPGLPIQSAPTLPEAPRSSAFERVLGLNTLRFLAALCVVVDHLRPIPIIAIPGASESHLLRAIQGALGNWLFNGPAAVIVFFLISGFCIALPYVNGQEPKLWEFYLRRFLRLLLPMPVVLYLASLTGVKLSFFNSSILWSLQVELIYYFLFPFLLTMVRSYGWTRVLGAAYLGAFATFLTNPHGMDYPSYGFELNWLLGLPCWLLGCRLAENYQHIRQEHAPWKHRALLVFTMYSAMILRHHTPIGYPITLTLFGVVAYFWLKQEIAFLRVNTKRQAWLERAGEWSYSLYLFHLPIGAWLLEHGFRTDYTIFRGIVFYSILFLVTYVFYRVFERPAHIIAKRSTRWLKPRSRSTPVDTTTEALDNILGKQ